MGAEIADWVRQHASRVQSYDPDAPLDDLEPLRAMMTNADVVGLGESTHGAHEQFALKHRVLRFLVQEMGFRTLALEEDWTKGVELDEYVVQGIGDLAALLADVGVPWRTEEIWATLAWMRRYNEAHAHDPVRFAGVDIVAARTLAYDAVMAFVREAAPARVHELEQHYTVIYPRGPITQHTEWYRAVENKEPLLEHARAVHTLVRGMPPVEGRALALQHARAILDFHVYHAAEGPGGVAIRDQHMAANTIWWRTHTGSKVVYWAASVHTANAPQLTVSYPPFPAATQPSVGSMLRDRYGRRYQSLGMMFDHGRVNAGFAPPAPQPVASAPPEFIESAFAGVGLDDWMLDLRAPAPVPVRSWLDAPAKTRLIGPAYDPGQNTAYWMAGGALADWFDVVVYRREVTPTRLLPMPPLRPPE